MADRELLTLALSHLVMDIDGSSVLLYDHKGTVAGEKQHGALATWGCGGSVLSICEPFPLLFLE